MRLLLPAAVVTLFATRFCIAALRRPAVDGDLAWQGWLGERILHTGMLPRSLAPDVECPGSPWLPQEWLFAILTALARRLALTPAFDLGVALCAVLALALLARRVVRDGASPLATLLCLLCAGIAMIDSFGVRAQVAGWPFLVAFGELLERGAAWPLCAAVAVVWANVHAGAVLAPVLAAAWAAGLALRDRALSPPVVRAALAAVASLLAVAVNPFGFGLVLYAAALVRSPIKEYIREWQPTTFGDGSFVWGALPLLLGAAAWALHDARRSPQRLCLLAAGAALLPSAARNIPVFALITAPYAALGFTQLLRRLGPALDAPPPLLTTSAALGLLMLAGATGIGLWRAPVAPAPAAALIGRLELMPGSYRLLCQDYAWCGPAVGKPRIRVFLDGRADPYPLPVWEAAFRVAHGQTGWQQALDAYGVNTIVADRTTTLDRALRTSPHWVPAGQAAGYALYLRRSRTPARNP